MCFVQTTELDGETNLKPVIASRYIEYHFKDIFIDKTIRLAGEFQPPSKDIYSYDGRITCTNGAKHKVIAADIKMFLHRGAVLRNSPYVFGLVTQTGVQTKVIMNQGSY